MSVAEKKLMMFKFKMSAEYTLSLDGKKIIPRQLYDSEAENQSAASASLIGAQELVSEIRESGAKIVDGANLGLVISNVFDKAAWNAGVLPWLLNKPSSAFIRAVSSWALPKEDAVLSDEVMVIVCDPKDSERVAGILKASRAIEAFEEKKFKFPLSISDFDHI